MELSSRVINYCNGNPLALKVLGSFLFGKSKQEQQNALDKLERNLNEDIQKVLRVSFNGLDHKDQGLFLDIACFFKGKNIKVVSWLLDRCGCFTDIGIRVLVDKCLVVIQNETIQMHDLLQQMGQEIVYQECPNEPGKRSRLWDHNDICHVLTKNKGTEAVNGIFLHLPKTRSVSLTSAAFERMYNLKLLEINGKVHLHEGLEYLPDELRYLHWDEYPLHSLPSKFHPENLVKLKLPNSLAQQLWSGKQNLANLEEIDLSCSENLISLPDLSLATNLESMNLIGCKSLSELWSGKQNLASLKRIVLSYCKNLKSLPDLSLATNLEYMQLRRCTSLIEPWSEKQNLASLKGIVLSYCENLKSLPDLSLATNLEFMDLDGCISLIELWSGKQNLSRLKRIILSFCENLKSLPNLSLATNLEFMELRYCTSLIELWSGKQNLASLKWIDLSYCESLKSLPDLSVATNLKSMKLRYCVSLTELPSSVQHLLKLKLLDLRRCKSLGNLPSSICKLESLEVLRLNGCPRITKFPEVPPSIEYLKLNETAIEEVPSSSIQFLTSLTDLRMSRCKRLKNLPTSICKLKRLNYLDFKGCPNLESFPEIMEKMERLGRMSLNGTAIKELAESLACNLPYLGTLELSRSNIQNIPTAINQLACLKELCLNGCEKLQFLPQLPMGVRRVEAEHCISLERVSTPFTAAAAAIGEVRTESLTNVLRFVREIRYVREIRFMFADCIKLDQNACKSIAADAELKFKIASTYTAGFGMEIFKTQAEICYPGSEVPDWFRYKSTGSSITIKRPPRLQGRRYSGGFLGLALCAVTDFAHLFDFDLHYKWNSKDKNGVVLNCGDGYFSEMCVVSNHVLLRYEQSLSCREEYCDGVDEISFEFRLGNQCGVKMCGIHFLYNEGRLSFREEEEEDDEPAPI